MFTVTKVYLILCIIGTIIKSIGKKWDDELRQIWTESFNGTIYWLWVPVLIDALSEIAYYFWLKNEIINFFR